MFRMSDTQYQTDSKILSWDTQIAYGPIHTTVVVKSLTDVFSNKYSFIFDNSTDGNFIVEINKKENEHILEIIRCAFNDICSYLEENEKNKYSINLYLTKDIEIPKWVQYVIEINSSLADFDAKELLWDKLIELFDQSYKEYIERSSIIEETEHEREAYRKISIIVD